MAGFKELQMWDESLYGVRAKAIYYFNEWIDQTNYAVIKMSMIKPFALNMAKAMTIAIDVTVYLPILFDGRTNFIRVLK